MSVFDHIAAACEEMPDPMAFPPGPTRRELLDLRQRLTYAALQAERLAGILPPIPPARPQW